MPLSLQVILFSLFTLFHTNLFAKSVPRLSAPVVDEANLIDSSKERALNSFLQQLNSQGIIQMAILTVDDLEDESLEGYSIKVVDQWKLGDQEKDNGLLILLSKNQRKVRIEVGQGLEGDIPDAIAKRIVDGMIPYFKQGQFDQGIIYAVATISKRLGVEGVSAPKANRRHKKKRSILPMIIFLIIFFLIFRRNPLLALMILSGHSPRGHGGGFGGGGGYSGGGGGFSGGGASGDW